MQQLHLNAFKWKPFDLYNDICIQQEPKINDSMVKTASRIKDNCCCANDHFRTHLSLTNDNPNQNHRNVDSKSINNDKNPLYLCEHCKSIYNFNVIFGHDKINDNNNCGVNWNALHSNGRASTNLHQPFVNNINVSGENSMKMHKNAKNNAIELKRDVENTSPISVYGPLPYSK